MPNIKFLPTTKQEMHERGWKELDVIFVTADAYCDFPSFGVALLSRLLEDEGFRVGIIAQPDWRNNEDFLKLGEPRLFFGITAGSLDSMLNIYTSFKNLRRHDKYSPGGAAGLRPKLPTIVYSHKIRSLFPKTPMVIGGLEASLRRFAHYDFWSEGVRRSILFDAKADILVYGMGEHQTLEIARRLKNKETAGSLRDIRGIVIAAQDPSFLENFVELPSFQTVVEDKREFLNAFRLYTKELNPYTAMAVVQKTDTRFCVQLPPALPLSTKEMDRIYGLKFSRRCHPMYDKFGGVPATKTVETSITSHRGCAANCSFCSLSLHQGRVIQSRSIKSIVQEAGEIASQPYFKGVISDIGGPTANMYAAKCTKVHRCAREDCLWPNICPNFKQDCRQESEMLEAVRQLAGVRHVYIQSGMRFDLLLCPEARDYFRQLCEHYISGQLKVAPEHVDDRVLGFMHKPAFRVYEKFIKEYEKLNKALGRKQYLAQYFITAHPGCGMEEAKKLAAFTQGMGYTPQQIQDFIPLPMTRSSVMYYTGLDPDTGKPLYVAKNKSDRMQQRKIVQP